MLAEFFEAPFAMADKEPAQLFVGPAPRQEIVGNCRNHVIPAQPPVEAVRRRLRLRTHYALELDA